MAQQSGCGKAVCKPRGKPWRTAYCCAEISVRRRLAAAAYTARCTSVAHAMSRFAYHPIILLSGHDGTGTGNRPPTAHRGLKLVAAYEPGASANSLAMLGFH
ncbi:Manganese peroxidase H3 [Anopheles sinensis]|uniref:Manganese peroxidase H3 n=1 Tax=Anopheles sinensis TaxID=74873 RepID=A0A084VN75_ANOSI|nr:Manganese peroxidase H3 [Anopheles sinensis]